MHLAQAREIVACAQETRPSLGPETRARRSSLCARQQCRVVRRSRWHRGWATPRKWEEPTPGLSRTDGARLAAFRRSRKRDAWNVRKGRRSRPPSLRGSRVRVWLPARRSMLQKSVGDVWSRISSANALQKERSGSSERGPSSEHGSAGETVGRRIERKARRESASPVKTRERTGAKTQGGERSSSSGSRIARKAVRESRDRGRKGHRILRRAPTDGSHPGSSRSVALHGAAWTRVSAVIGIPRPAPNLQKEVVRPGCSARESTRGVGTNRRLRQGCQRLDRVEHRGNNTPALVS
jgi:hypothetical protein